MVFSKRIIKILSLVLAFAIVISGFSALADNHADVAKLQEQMASLESQANSIKGEIAKLEQDESNQEKLRAELQRQVENTDKQIALCDSEIAKLGARIAELNEQIKQKEQELEDSKQLFKARLRAIYMTGDINDLFVFLKSSDVADYLAKSELTRSVSKQDAALMENIKDAVKTIGESKTAVEEDKAAKAEVQKTLEVKQSEIEAQVTKTEAVIKEIQKDEAVLQEEHSQLMDASDEAAKQVEEKIAEIMAQEAAEAAERARKAAEEAARKKAAEEAARKQQEENKADELADEEDVKNPPSDTTKAPEDDDKSVNFLWPSKFKTVTSPFGYRIHPISGTKKLHSGIDIAGSGINGTPIYAADSGKVSYTSYDRYGYGYYVMISHGVKSDNNSYITLYAHMQRYIVSEGQTVERGEIIGYVGSTGGSTGPHIHYEIRVNGTPVNPMKYY